MPVRKVLLAAVAAAVVAASSAPISADQDPALLRLRAIAGRPDVVSALSRYGDLAASANAGYGTGWEQDMLHLQHKLQSEVFGTP